MCLFYWLRVSTKLLLRRFACIDSFCKECGRNIHDFRVDNDTWNMVEPLIKRGHTLCYDCFCEKCREAGLSTVWKLERLP